MHMPWCPEFDDAVPIAVTFGAHRLSCAAAPGAGDAAVTASNAAGAAAIVATATTDATATDAAASDTAITHGFAETF